jgi:voltage-gated potassium channel
VVERVLEEGGDWSMPIERRIPSESRSPAETDAAPRAERVAGRLRVPLIVAALLAIPTIVVQEASFGGFWEPLTSVMDWCIWGVFAANLVIMLAVVPDRRRWLLENPMDVLIVALTPPFLPASMKVARVLPVVRLLWLMVLANRLHSLFSLQGLRYAALIVFTVVVGGGVVFDAAEPGQDLSTWDGLWWAAETVTTVAYGDVYPTTALGRVVATVVMTTGIGFVALLTGALAQRFLYGRSEGVDPGPAASDDEISRKLDDVSRQISEIQEVLRKRHD